jgi:hypothetical protein
MSEINPDSAVIIDASVLIAVGGPENEKFQALAEYATQRDLVLQLPRRVLGEVDESPSTYEPQRARVRAALDQGWMVIAPTPDYTSSTVAGVMDAVRARMADKADSRDDIVEKTDTALAGLAVHLLTTDPGVEIVTILMADTGAVAAMRDVFSARSYDDSISIVDGRRLAAELAGDDDMRLL